MWESGCIWVRSWQLFSNELLIHINVVTISLSNISINKTIHVGINILYILLYASNYSWGGTSRDPGRLWTRHLVFVILLVGFSTPAKWKFLPSFTLALRHLKTIFPASRSSLNAFSKQYQQWRSVLNPFISLSFWEASSAYLYTDF